MRLEKELKFIKYEIEKAYTECSNIDYDIVQKSAFDLVTDIDLNIEKRLSAAIRETFPGDVVLGEEYSNDADLAVRTWTIDPIDGTCNMANGSKLYGVQCSLIENRDIVLAVIYLPHFNEWIYAVKGEGCYCNGEKLHAATDITVNNAIISFGDYPHKATGRTATIQHAVIGKVYPQIAKIRMFGAACIDFSSVAQGRTHGTFIMTGNLWDIAPGILLCCEAGAVVTNLKGKPYVLGDDGVIVAANQELSDLLNNSLCRKIEVNTGKEKLTFKGCIFDFDGVIIDTEKYHYLGWKKAFEFLGVDLSESEYLPLKSTGRDYIIKYAEGKVQRTFKEDEKSEALRIKDELFDKLLEQLSEKDFIAGVKDFLGCLQNKALRVAVASSSITTTELINRFSLGKLFDEILDGNVKLPKKPAPDVFLEAAKRLGVKPEECIVFEDSLAGIDAAVNAGIAVVAIGEIQSDKALFCLKDFTEIFEFIEG